MLRTLSIAGAAFLGSVAALAAQEVSVERGELGARIFACHDCHTERFAESNGKLDPAASLKGRALGYRGPWGTTYPANLRIVAAEHTEDSWVEFLQTFEARPPMPWFNVHLIPEADLRSLYLYVKSLGEPGDPAPAYVPPDQEPRTPYQVMAPPTMPKQG